MGGKTNFIPFFEWLIIFIFIRAHTYARYISKVGISGIPILLGPRQNIILN